MTSHDQNKTKGPPNADEILSQFSNPMLKTCRVALLVLLKVVTYARRIHWNVSGIEHINVVDSPIIFASNHQSHVDTHVILATLPKPFRSKTAVAAAFDHFADTDGTSVKKRAIQFFVAALWHAFSIERLKSPIRSIRTMQDLLAHGWSLVIYPEGTRSRTGNIARFKPGLAILAKKSGRPVIPIYIEGSMDVLPEATYLPHRGSIRISFGEPLHFQQDETSAEFMVRVQDSVLQLAKNT